MNRDTERLYQRYNVITEAVDPNLFIDTKTMVGGTLLLKIGGKDYQFVVTKVELRDASSTDGFGIFGRPDNDYPDLHVDATSGIKGITADKTYRIIGDNASKTVLDAPDNEATDEEKDWKKSAQAIPVGTGGTSDKSKEGEEKTFRQIAADYVFGSPDVGNDPVSQWFGQKILGAASGDGKQASIKDYSSWAY